MSNTKRTHHDACSKRILFIMTLLLLPTEMASYSFLPSLSSCATPTFQRKTTAAVSTITTAPNSNRSFLTMKVGKRKSKTSSVKGSSISLLNSQRQKTAGRKGTKNFVDPNKVFLGNVPFQATEDDVMKWFGENLGTTNNIESLKIIRDWKTGNSKGYGFVNFMDPICATSAMELLKGRRLMGRALKLSQGQKKKDDNILIVKKREKKEEQQQQQSKDEESDVIDSALDEIEQIDNDDDMFLFEGGDDYEDYDDDDEEFEYDGVFEEIYKVEYEPLSEEDANKVLNREQKREILKRRKKKKLPHKGFG
mmetsp:Transcript_42492/g.62071  ORF Transcript_42492/g.62071 Transcript_42492/m.62071 type:complete len:308 (-) Transcript_42492:398-1321(-)